MFKSLFPESRNHLPLTWWNQTPIYLAAIIALVGAVSMVIYAIFSSQMIHLVFNVETFQQWHLWTPFTYVLVNDPSLWILIGCYLLWRFGESLEQHFGRYIFVKLLVLLLLVSPITVTILHFIGFKGFSCVGMMALESAVFIAFATLYPRACISLIIVTLNAWILATIFVVIGVLQCIAGRDWGSLILLLVNVGSAYFFVKVEKGEINVPTIKILPDDKKKESGAPKVGKKQKSTPSKSSPTSLKVDNILDKINKEGLGSLTDEERRILDEASRGPKT